ncbi:hypothetical protein [Paenibacillus urinalis]|uniref:LXG domain-containing protein n=1 Tax=Paenibacillus urinalis TaxID=521520 RepID=A0AAX3N0G4_9BACL|nr:hypothetical protein [Paenibacillus urinalis]WDH83328.1 hypothetical protein PUW23_03530 [Paenibacillus urinalis]
MSRQANYNYALEQQRRRQIYLQQVRETTEQYLCQFEQIMHDCTREGFEQFAPAEMNEARQLLSMARSQQSSDPEAARDSSRRLGALVHQIRPLARAVERKLELDRQAKLQRLLEQKRRAKTDATAFFYELLGSITDPVVRDFAIPGLDQVKQQLDREIESVAPSELATYQETMMRNISEIIERAEVQAEAWKQEAVAGARQEIQLQTIQTQIERIRSVNTDNEQAIRTALEELQAMEATLKRGASLDNEQFAKSVEKAAGDADSAVLDDRIMRETVKLIAKSLRDSDFVLDGPPMLQEDGFVTLHARKPSGRQAWCKVNLHGEFSYKFDQYEGQACREDIAQFRDKLEEIYGMKLSNERITWENPDRLSATAKPLDDRSHRDGQS